MKLYPAVFIVVALILSAVASGCVSSQTDWAVTINGDSAHTINSSLYADIVCSNVTLNGANGVPLEQFLYRFGVYPVTSVTIGTHTYDWASLSSMTIDNQPVLVMPDGRIFDGQTYARVDDINVTTADRPAHTSLEIEPSMLYALGIGGNGSLVQDKSHRIVLFYVDALGYERYELAKSEGIINNMTSLGEPAKLTCVYPSISIMNSKTLVTGIPPNASKGDFRNHTPGDLTILDTAKQHGMTAYWIGGKTSPVALGDFMISRPDVDGNGYEADEVTTEAIAKYNSGANLLFVHFKDTDSVAHAKGPCSDESMAALQFVDMQIGRMLPLMDPGTIVILYADHGGHDTFYGGNHGTLTSSDMIVPFLVHVV